MTQVTAQQLENAALDCATIEAVATSTDPTVTDRLGNVKRTLTGAIEALGYEPPVAYVAGISVTSSSQTVEYSGALYSAKASAVPFTTGASFDATKWRLLDAGAAAAAAAAAEAAQTAAEDALTAASAAQTAAEDAAATATTLSGEVASLAGVATRVRMSVGTASASATITADEVVVTSALGGATRKLGSISEAINLATTGAGGMDTGLAPVSGYVSIYLLHNPTTADTIAVACNETVSSGTLYAGANAPSGYTESALVGIWPTNSSRQFKAGVQVDRRVTLAPVNVIDSDSGNPTSYTALSLSTAVPASALAVSGTVGSGTTTDGAHVALAANASGIGEMIFMAAVTSSNFLSFAASSGFRDFPLISSQQLHYKCRAAGQPIRLDINGYTF